MWDKLPFRHGGWSVLDQGVVSGGGFLVNVLLARKLPAADYGVFAMLFGGMLTLQLFNATLLFHPISVRLATAAHAGRQPLLRSSLVLVLALSAMLGLGLTACLALFGQGWLAGPALACFLTWQIQEMLRRALLTELRLRSAVVGDVISYMGQALVVFAFSLTDGLSLSGVLWCMAATSAAAIGFQVFALRLQAGRLEVGATAAIYWRFGGFWSLGNGLLSQLRVQFLPWALAVSGGPALAAAFQAAVNVVNVSNPIVISINNMIPQTVARANVDGGIAAAWNSALGYGMLAVPPLLCYVIMLLTFPSSLLRILYGSGSDFLGLGYAVQVLVVAAVVGYATDLIVAFLHGIIAIRQAFWINTVGALGTVLFALPLIAAIGLAGACFAVLAANLIRLMVSYLTVGRLMHVDAPAAT